MVTSLVKVYHTHRNCSHVFFQFAIAPMRQWRNHDQDDAIAQFLAAQISIPEFLLLRRQSLSRRWTDFTSERRALTKKYCVQCACTHRANKLASPLGPLMCSVGAGTGEAKRCWPVWSHCPSGIIKKLLASTSLTAVSNHSSVSPVTTWL